MSNSAAWDTPWRDDVEISHGEGEALKWKELRNSANKNQHFTNMTPIGRSSQPRVIWAILAEAPDNVSDDAILDSPTSADIR